MSKLRAAVVGVGYLGNFHAQKYKALSDRVELVGVCDFYKEQSGKIASQLGVNSFHEAKDLIGKVDLVTIAASTQSHFELAKLFLDNGIHVNVEKPITATLKQGEEIVNLAAQKNLKLAVGHIERFNPSILAAKSELNSQPKSIELIRYAPYKARGADVSVLHDLMIHDIDLMYWLTGSEVQNFSVSGSKLVSKEHDTCMGTFEMQNGTLVHIDVSRVSTQGRRSVRFIEDTQILNVNSGTLEIEKLTCQSGQENPLQSKVWTVDKKDALQSETEAFINAVEGKSPLAVTGEDGLKALRLVENLVSRIK